MGSSESKQDEVSQSITDLLHTKPSLVEFKTLISTITARHNSNVSREKDKITTVTVIRNFVDPSSKLNFLSCLVGGKFFDVEHVDSNIQLAKQYLEELLQKKYLGADEAAINDVNMRNATSGTTALHHCENGSVLGPILLLEGGDPNIQDHAGRTPLMLAAARFEDKFVQEMVAAGGNVSIRDGAGRNAIVHALTSSNFNSAAAEKRGAATLEALCAVASNEEKQQTMEASFLAKSLVLDSSFVQTQVPIIFAVLQNTASPAAEVIFKLLLKNGFSIYCRDEPHLFLKFTSGSYSASRREDSPFFSSKSKSVFQFFAHPEEMKNTTFNTHIDYKTDRFHPTLNQELDDVMNPPQYTISHSLIASIIYNHFGIFSFLIRDGGFSRLTAPLRVTATGHQSDDNTATFCPLDFLFGTVTHQQQKDLTPNTWEDLLLEAVSNSLPTEQQQDSDDSQLLLKSFVKSSAYCEDQNFHKLMKLINDVLNNGRHKDDTLVHDAMALYAKSSAKQKQILGHLPFFKELCDKIEVLKYTPDLQMRDPTKFSPDWNEETKNTLLAQQNNGATTSLPFFISPKMIHSNLKHVTIDSTDMPKIDYLAAIVATAPPQLQSISLENCLSWASSMNDDDSSTDWKEFSALAKVVSEQQHRDWLSGVQLTIQSGTDCPYKDRKYLLNVTAELKRKSFFKNVFFEDPGLENLLDHFVVTMDSFELTPAPRFLDILAKNFSNLLKRTFTLRHIDCYLPTLHRFQTRVFDRVTILALRKQQLLEESRERSNRKKAEISALEDEVVARILQLCPNVVELVVGCEFLTIEGPEKVMFNQSTFEALKASRSKLQKLTFEGDFSNTSYVDGENATAEQLESLIQVQWESKLKVIFHQSGAQSLVQQLNDAAQAKSNDSISFDTTE